MNSTQAAISIAERRAFDLEACFLLAAEFAGAFCNVRDDRTRGTAQLLLECGSLWELFDDLVTCFQERERV